jgi:hypothetical protein
MKPEDAPVVPDLLLEQFRLNELPAVDAARVARRLGEDAALRARLAGLERSDEAIAREYPPEWLARQVRARLSVQPHRAPRNALRPLAVASALATLILVLLVPLVMTSNDQDRVKGLSPAIAVYRRTPQGSEKLADGALARAGDLLRVGYVAAGRPYGVILSIDGRGVVTRHLPVQGPAAVPLRKDGIVLLDAAYEIDDAPAWERFYFVTADEPFDVAPVLDAARRAASGAPRLPDALPLPRTFVQSTFALQKEVKP